MEINKNNVENIETKVEQPTTSSLNTTFPAHSNTPNQTSNANNTHTKNNNNNNNAMNINMMPRLSPFIQPMNMFPSPPFYLQTPPQTELKLNKVSNVSTNKIYLMKTHSNSGSSEENPMVGSKRRMPIQMENPVYSKMNKRMKLESMPLPSHPPMMFDLTNFTSGIPRMMPPPQAMMMPPDMTKFMIMNPHKQSPSSPPMIPPSMNLFQSIPENKRVKFKCAYPNCPQTFDKTKELYTHLRLQHKTDYRCPHCDKKANCMANFVSHIRTHTNEKPWPCPHDGCEYRGRTKNHAKCHAVQSHGVGCLTNFEQFFMQDRKKVIKKSKKTGFVPRSLMKRTKLAKQYKNAMQMAAHAASVTAAVTMAAAGQPGLLPHPQMFMNLPPVKQETNTPIQERTTRRTRSTANSTQTFRLVASSPIKLEATAASDSSSTGKSSPNPHPLPPSSATQAPYPHLPSLKAFHNMDIFTKSPEEAIQHLLDFNAKN